MSDDTISDMLSRLSHKDKKEALERLVTHLLRDLSAEERQRMVNKVLGAGDEGRRLSSMVDH